ncbi:ABC transporter [Desulfosarcina ovata subsp. sediminis]|uniref:ABC transporter n=2 Tax=Desulfosarcina ovata TaxID=83564 RepID=A0A5K7ZCE9_9BACT|nr:ABC transporter [Desulfosarcina ovata subsp. sediminis]
MLGIIGPNGSGKSTLLRLIGGVGKPDEGFVSANGRIGALFDLGAGFHPELTGRDNIYIAGVIAGLTRRQITERFDEIVSFAEMEDFLDNPLRTYSSGMKLRLAFAVAVNIDPDILLIDEVLSVGDLSFQNKCLKRIRQYKKNGCTVLLVSHDTEQVLQLCDEVIWIKKGRVKSKGMPPQVIQDYRSEVSKETRKRTPTTSFEDTANNDTGLKLNENRFGSLEVRITGVRLIGKSGMQENELNIGDPLRIEIDFQSDLPVKDPIFGATITNRDGTICCEMMTAQNPDDSAKSIRKGTIVLDITRLDLIGGEYYINTGIYKKDWEYAYDFHCNVYPLRIMSDSYGKGYIVPPHTWHFKNRR